MDLKEVSTEFKKLDEQGKQQFYRGILNDTPSEIALNEYASHVSRQSDKQKKETVKKFTAKVESGRVWDKPSNEGTVSQNFKRCVIRSGLNDKLHFHSLRHSFASALVISGESIYVVSKLLGHASSNTTEIYSHLLPSQLHKEVNILAGMFTGQQVNALI